MNIYLACSITSGREFESVYQAITQALLDMGHDVPTAHLAASDAPEVEAALPPDEVYSRDVSWIRSCDMLIAEASVPSHGVGYEIGYALGIGKPVLVLCRKDRKITKMISGNPDANLTLKIYASTSEAIDILRQFLSPRG